jgi:hypothetical protein
LKAFDHILLSSVETRRPFNPVFDTVNQHRPTLLGQHHLHFRPRRHRQKRKMVDIRVGLSSRKTRAEK